MSVKNPQAISAVQQAQNQCSLINSQHRDDKWGKNTRDGSQVRLEEHKGGVRTGQQ